MTLENRVFSDAAVKEAAREWVCVKVDPRDTRDASEHKSTRYVPELVMLTSDGERIDTLEARDPAGVAAALRAIAEEYRVVDEPEPVEETVATAEQQAYAAATARERSAPRGKVIAVDQAANLVVVSIGEENKLASGTELFVYRGDQLIAKLRTSRVNPETSGAEIVRQEGAYRVKVGDVVTTVQPR